MTFILESALVASGLATAGAEAAAMAGTVSSVVSGVGTVASAVGAYAQGQGQQQMAEYNARIMQNNANSADVAGQQEAGRLYDINQRKMASARAAYGASGASMNIGTPVDVMVDQAGQAALDQEIARWRGKVAATGYRNEAASQIYQGEQAAQAGLFKAGGLLLNGFGRLGPGVGGSSASVDPWANIPGRAGWY